MLFLRIQYFHRWADNYLIYILFFAGLVLLKVIASSSTNGAGGVGGIFAPTLFIGGVNRISYFKPGEQICRCRSSRQQVCSCRNGRHDGRCDACSSYSNFSDCRNNRRLFASYPTYYHINSALLQQEALNVIQFTMFSLQKEASL